ncbi:MAG: hypothetical protein IPN69_08430 [Acidobacteria bacterium]|nr:hypothetical protein [Acidobacteriota bacterium]
MSERSGAIPSNITVAAGQAIRRNALDTAFEAFTPPAGTGLSDGDYGDITVSGGGTVMSLDAGVGGLTQPQVMARTLGC